MDANGIAGIIVAVIMIALGVYKKLPQIMAIINGTSNDAALTNGEKTKDKPTIANLNARIDDLENKLKEAKEDYAKALKENGEEQQRFQTQIDQQQKEFGELRDQNQREIAEKLQVTRQRDEAEDKYHRLLEKSNEDQKTIISMGNTLDTLENRISELEHQLAVNTSVEQAFIKFGDRLVESLKSGIQSAIQQVAQPNVNVEANPT